LNAAEDILPISGSVQFITGMRERTITLEIQPDNLPEDDEVNYTVILGTFKTLHILL